MSASSLNYAQVQKSFSNKDKNAYWVLSILAFYGIEVSLESLYRTMKDMGLEDIKQDSLTYGRLSALLKDLANEGWISRQRSNETRVNPAYQEAIARSAFLEFPKISKDIVKNIFKIEKLSERVNLYAFNKREKHAYLIIRLQFLTQHPLFLDNFSVVARQANWYEQWTEILQELMMMTLPFDKEWYGHLKKSFLTHSVLHLFFSPAYDQTDISELIKLVGSTPPSTDSERYELGYILTHSIARRGVIETAPKYNDRLQSSFTFAGLQGLQAVLTKDISLAHNAFENYIKTYNNKILADSFFSVVYILWFFEQKNQVNKLIQTTLGDAESFRRNGFCFEALDTLIDFYHGEEESSIDYLDVLIEEYLLKHEDFLVYLWCCYWMGAPINAKLLVTIETQMEAWEDSAQLWLYGEACNIMAKLHPDQSKHLDYKVKAAAIAEKFAYQQYIGELFTPLASWERVLKSFERIANGQDSAKVDDKRLVWLIDMEDREITPKEQKMGKKGKWSAGRKIGLNKIYYHELESMTAHDKKLSEALENQYDYGGYYRASANDLFFDFDHALYLLADHPLLFLDGRQTIPFEVVAAQPQLFITENEDGVSLKIEPQANGQSYVVQKETPTRYKVYQMDEEQQQISKTISSGINVPNEAIPRLEQLVGNLRKKISIHSSLDLQDSDLPQVSGDPKPCIHLLPFKEGFKVQFTAKPLADEAHYFPLGQGISKQILSTASGDVVCTRDLLQERELMQQCLEQIEVLKANEHEEEEWQIEDTQDCLLLLLQLKPLKEAGLVSVEYPKGEKIKLVAVNSTNDLSLRIQQERDWFSMDGELQIDEDQVMGFQHLLEHIQQTESPFIQLKEGEFIALTEEFRQRLKSMEGMLHKKGKHLQLSNLAAPMVDDFSEELAELEIDNAWNEQLERMRKATNIRPRLPRGFQAELRPYQKEGFRWLMRLAEWGVGACLADDMGLGKTVQALSLLSARDKKGPSMVIAPASVTRNWKSETEKFAPALTPLLLESSKDISWIKNLEAGDLLIVSYGLLPFVSDLLVEIPFNTVVLDEAQAIKNRATKRSKIVMQLQADFRIATTGTPIENHLGELWNLFRFLNPGLLGSHQAFSDKFGKPILRDNDDGKREHLRRLIHPFILRRLKTDVLTELPAKTEISLDVELSAEELAFYESLRRQALEQIAQANGNEKRFTVLAQLTKLRQAACHPRLVDPKTRLGSAKLQLVGETVLDLLENDHKVLIFSQFVRHLKIVEQWIQSEGINYQYLDGQTPNTKREKAVKAFQAGDGDVFLISLKAGGTGLNLTQADYVLHLDPWWNPAVEDQASDRAHRIGQQRPVTVYRFVTQHTIEEKIVKLHGEKRQLADQLLSGTEASAKLSIDDMLDMLKG